MKSNSKPGVGVISWTDLTVRDAITVRDFYKEVVGWTPEPVPMGDYEDFNMNAPAGNGPIAGICHARGVNADLPPQWLIYVIVEDIARSIARCVELGGKVITGPKSMGSQGTYCVIQDPAGAVAALFQQGD